MSAINAELAELLASAGCDVPAGTESAWSRVVMVHNVSRVPRGGPRRKGSIANRGFNLLLLDKRGRPSHYVKCRQAGDTNLRRETRIMAALHAHPELRSIVPNVRAIASERLELHVSPYIRGENFQASIDKLSARAWEKAASGILLAADRVADLAVQLCADIAVSGRLRVETETTAALRALVELGLSADDADVLRRAIIAASSATPHPQHGDLWPANIVRTRRGWQILDFEDYGLVQMPLFDVLHLVRSAPGTQPENTPGGWFAAMSGAETSWTRATREVIGAAVSRRGLHHGFVAGALAYYLVTMAARLRERGNPRSRWESVLLEARALASMLRAGESPSRLLVA